MSAPAIGDLHPPFPGVVRVALLRGGGLGDLLFALPAAEALAATYSSAELTLLGTRLHAALLSERPSPFASIEVLPSRPELPPDGSSEPSAVAARAFVGRMRERRFDLGVQVHGGGRTSNPYLLALGARHTVGTRTDDAAHLERTFPYLYYQHEVLRALEVVGLAGAPPLHLEPRLRLTPDERERRSLARSRPPGARPLVAIHPGATDPRRRWPADRFAQVAAALAGDGARVVVVGDESDSCVATEIVRAAEGAGAATGSVRSVAGERTLAGLIELLLDCAVLVANDSGPRHLALAVGTPTVGIYWFGNVINASPLSRAHHRIHFAWTSHCPVCGRDCTQVGWTAERCEHDDSFVADVPVGPVLTDARQLLTGPPPHDQA